MRPIQSIRLEAVSGSGSKFYSIFLNHAGQETYTVDFEYGAVGDSPRTGTKTKVPVALDLAKNIFAKLQDSKMYGDSHYQVVSEGAAVEPALAAMPVIPIAGVPTSYPVRLLNDIDDADKMPLIEDADWWVQLKHDGDRVQLQYSSDGAKSSIHFFSGRSARLRALPASIKKSLEKSGKGQFVIDGELVGDVIWAFDLMFIGDADLRDRPYAYRYKLLCDLVTDLTPTSGIRLVKAAQIYDDKARLILKARDDQAEGVVFVRKTAAYTAGKGGDNLRWKFTASASVIVSGHNMENGKSSVNFKLFDGTEIGTCSIIGKEVPPVGAVIEVEYLYMMGSLVQPRLKGLRHDVEPEACIREQLRFKDGIDPKKGKK